MTNLGLYQPIRAFNSPTTIARSQSVTCPSNVPQQRRVVVGQVDESRSTRSIANSAHEEEEELDIGAATAEVIRRRIKLFN
ncbi:hypothetical protein E2C01_045829 [Portunus trituberculatus]|uniref:Uncharacterized protein n=1 Tax=Portunus trituberculatus TaxID=210409 RepID=A0A5B7FWT9_PORTR|nr:hypothetical protein [Portunus trituberculatus]